MKLKILVLAAACATSAVVFGKAAKGSCISKAHSLKTGTQTARLVQEYDSEEDEKEERYLDSGAAYYKMELKRGQAYTVWITGGNASEIQLDVDTNWEYYDKDSKADKEPAAGFDIFSLDGGNTQVAYLYADDWSTDPYEPDPKTGKYVVYLSSDDIGATTTLGFAKGIVQFDIVGSDESPRVLSMSDTLKTYSGRLVDGDYHFRATLSAGRKYRVRTLGGTASAPLDVDVGSVIADDDADDNEEWQEVDKARLTAYNDAMIIVPETTGKFDFVVSGEVETQAFKFQYQAVPKRKITAHPAIPLLKSEKNHLGEDVKGEYEAKFKPGRISDSHNYYDNIIDDNLCKIYLAKGETWAFETEGASKPQQMYVYGPSGAVLGSNSSIGNGNFDTLVVIKASAAGVYYVGVCDPNLDVDETPTGDTITLRARCVDGWLPADSYDPMDADIAGASIIVPYPTNGWTYVERTVVSNDVEIVELVSNVTWAVAATVSNEHAIALGAIHNDHRLNMGDLYDTFAFACRRGYTYKVRASYENDSEATDLTLKATVFNINGKKERVVAGTGTISPVGGDVLFDDDDFTFTANTNAVHYVRVQVNEGLGLEYPTYRLHVIASKGTNAVALLRVVSEGADGTWSINTEKFAYLPGTTLTLDPAASVKVRANAVSGFQAPTNQTVALPAWSDGDPVVTVTNRYTDIYDKRYQTGVKGTVKLYSPADGDATPAGAFAITPKAAATTLKRTLWTDDPADHFTFTAVTNVYYNFSVTNTYAGGLGDAVITVSNAVSGVVYEGVTEISRALLPVGKTFVIVSHGTEEKADTSYVLSFSKAAGGIVRFTNAKGVATSSFVANETAASAVLYVARTGNEGAMRVVYATQAGTAQPGTNYYPICTNEIKWAAGDKAVKAIKVNLIPESTPFWAVSNLTFTVKLLPVDEYALEGGEYFAIIPSDTATVTIKNTSAKKPGTVALSAYSVDAVNTNAVPNVKKPVAQGTAGQSVTLMFSRTGGTDGPVSVRVASPAPAVAKKNKDTALAGTDYEAFDETLTWAEGEDDLKTVTVNLSPSASYAASKKFVFTIATVRTDGTVPVLPAKSATVTILNDTVAQTAVAYAKTIAAATGLKLASTGTWFTEYDGTLRSGAANGTLTYTLTGPGFFVCKPILTVDDPETNKAALVCQIVNKTAKLNETVTNFTSRLARIIPAGTTTVQFKLSGVTGDAYVKFEPQADGAPYAWTRFALTEPAPLNKAVVKTNETTLAWTLPAAIAGVEGLYCRVRYGTAAKTMAVVTNDFSSAGPAVLASPYAPNKTYYWTVDYAYSEEAGLTQEAIAALPWTPGPTTWTFTTIKDGAPVTAFLDDEDPSNNPKDMAGNDVFTLVAGGDPIELIQGINVKSLGIQLAGAGEGDAAKTANKFRLLAGTLPKGVSINATSGLLTGSPSAVGTYTALLQSFAAVGTYNSRTRKTTYTYTYGTTLPVKFEVLPGGTMFGSYRGALIEDGSTFLGEAPHAGHAGNITVTTTAAGKITAKVTIAGVTYTFAGSAGFDELLDRDESAPGVTREVQVTLGTTVKTVKNKKVTGTYPDNTLVLTFKDGSPTNAAALAESVGSAELTMNVLYASSTAVKEYVSYTAALYRNNGTAERNVAAMADFAGYYTMALVPEGLSAPDEGLPVGNGYLTFTVANAGTVKVTGVLADGTAVSFSTFGQLVGDSLDDARACELMIPIYVGNAAYALAGTVKIAFASDDADALPVVKSAEKLVWLKNAAAATSRDASGFAIDLVPTGGWYDKVVNLQTYYINQRFSVSVADEAMLDYLPAEALANANYRFSTLSTPNDLEMKFAGNAMTVATRSLVKNKTTGLYDFDTSVNPWNTSVKFNRATGIVTGAFSPWEWIFKNDELNTYASAQMQMTSVAHKGILLFARDDSGDSPLADEVLTAGFFLMPATSSTKAAVRNKAWKASLPFNIIMQPDVPLWDEREDLQPDGM